MNRLAMIAAASCFALFLTGCGEGSKPVDTNQQQQQSTDQQQQNTTTTQPSSEGQSQ